MCRYTTTTLTTTSCSLYRDSGTTHTYTKYIYWLCRDSHGGQPCKNNRPKEDQIGNDVGSRRGPCPVCENMRVADEKYKLDVQQATEVYNVAVKRAYETMQAENIAARNDVETIPYAHQSSRSDHHHRHGYN